MRRFSLNWQGWVVPDKLPSKAGIYCVWASGLSSGKDASPRLLYIGESSDIATRVAGHEKWNCWKEHCHYGENVIFTYTLLPTAEVSENWRKAVENCLIAHHQPPCNDSDTTYHWTQGVEIRNVGVTFGKLRTYHSCEGTDE